MHLWGNGDFLGILRLLLDLFAKYFIHTTLSRYHSFLIDTLTKYNKNKYIYLMTHSFNKCLLMLYYYNNENEIASLTGIELRLNAPQCDAL